MHCTSSRYSIPCPTSWQRKAVNLQSVHSNLHPVLPLSSTPILPPHVPEELNAIYSRPSVWMICPRWTPRATATLANLGGSSRRASCRHAPISSRGEELGSRRWFSTAGGADEDGSSGSPSPEGSQSSGRVHRASSRSTAAPVKEQTPHHLPHRRTRTAASRTAKAADPRRHWTDRKNAGGDHDAAGESTDTAHQMWPQLKRRERPRKHGDEHVENAAFAIPKPVFSPRRSVQNPSGTSDSSGFMLAIDGLSPNLSATDFYRIAPNDFSNWRNAICKGTEPLPVLPLRTPVLCL